MVAGLVTSVLSLPFGARCIGAPSVHQGYPRAITQWKAVPPPAYRSRRWYGINRSLDSWKVERRGKRVVVRPFEYERDRAFPVPIGGKTILGKPILGHTYSIQVDDGYIVGRHYEEARGDLLFLGRKGKQKYRISSDTITAEFVNTPFGLLGFRGLIHLATTEGSVIKIERSGTRWTAHKFVELPQGVDAACLNNKGELVVATTSMLVVVPLANPGSAGIRTIVKDAFWRGLHSNSVAVGGRGTINIGMGGGVARIDPRGQKIDFLVPRKPIDR